MSKILRWLKSDYIKVYIFDLIAKGLSALISILIIRVLTIQDYSDYTYFFSISSFLSGILGSGIGVSYTSYAVEIQEIDENADAVLFEKLLKSLLVIYPLLSLCILFGIASFIGGDLLTIVFGTLYGMLLSFNQIGVVFFQARKKYIIAGIISNIRSAFVSVVLAFILTIDNRNVVYVYMVYTIAVLVSIAITRYLINSRIKNIEKVVYDDISIKNMLKDSVWTILYMFAISAFNQVDVMMLKLFTDDIAVANYGVAFKYYSLVISLLPAIQVVLRVNSSSGQMQDPSVRRQQVKQWTRKVTPFAIFLLTGGVVGAHLLFPIINGQQYNAAIYAFDVLMIGTALSYITAPNVSIMVGAKKQKILFVLSIASFISNVIGNYLLIPVGGIVAASATTIFAHFVLNGGSTLYLLLDGKHKRTKLSVGAS